MPTLPVLVILRGHSASGKSTVARRVQHALPRGRVAVVGQDHVRRDLLRERDGDPVDTIDLAPTIAAAVGARPVAVLRMSEAPSHPHHVARGAFTVHDGAAVPSPPLRFTPPDAG